MSIGKVKLKTLISKAVSGEWGEGEGEINVLRTTNFNNDGSIDYSEVVKRDIPEKKVFQKALMFGDTIIEKSGGSPKQPVGRVVYFDKKDDVFLCNNFTSALRPNAEANAKYVFWYLFNNHLTGRTLKYQNKTTGIINLQLERYLKDLEISLPPLTIQKQITEFLDKADALRKKDLELLKHYDALAQSLFIEMFGDPVKNEMGWEVMLLGKIFEGFKYGTNEKSANEFIEGSTPVLRIPNVIADDISLDDIKYSFLSEKEVKQTELLKGDLLFVRTNGNPNNIGRCAVYNLEGKYSYASYLIRARMKTENYPFSLYIQKALSHKSYRPLMLKKATTTAGNYNINTVSLKSLSVQCPPNSILQYFNKQIQNIELQKGKVKAQIQASENLFRALLQKAFNGGL